MFSMLTYELMKLSVGTFYLLPILAALNMRAVMNDPATSMEDIATLGFELRHPSGT